MDSKQALTAFGALSQKTRLQVFRLLVEHGPDGVAAGVLSDGLGIPQNTLSFHLSHMAEADLITSRREGRSIIYSANFEFFGKLIRYMIEDCCQGNFSGKARKDRFVIELDSCFAPKGTRTST